MASVEVENNTRQREKASPKAILSIAQEPYVVIAAVVMDPLGVKTVYSAMTVKNKKVLERSATEIWVPKYSETIQEMMYIVLQRAANLMPSGAKVYFTVPGLDDVKVLPRYGRKFVPIKQKDNPCYQIAEDLAKSDWVKKYT